MNISMAELCRKHNVTPNALYDWKEKFIQLGKLALEGSVKSDPSRELAEKNERPKMLIGALMIANNVLKNRRRKQGRQSRARPGDARRRDGPEESPPVLRVFKEDVL